MLGVTGFNWDSILPSVSHLWGEFGGFEVMLEWMLMYPNLNISRPFATYADGGSWRV